MSPSSLETGRREADLLRRMTPASVAFVAPLVVYLMTLCRTVTAEDSGELAAAAVTLGVPHPPGYPLWVLLGHLSSYLPAASPVHAVGYLSAFMGAATCWLVHLTCREAGLQPSTSLLGSLLLAFSSTFWSQATVVEVYTLNSALLVAQLLFLLRLANTRKGSYLVGLAAVWGLALANHYMLTLVVTPALAAYFGVALQTQLSQAGDADRASMRKALVRSLPLAGLAVVGALTTYAYLPWAASREPLMNWGDPSTLENLWAHVSRRAYRSLELAESVTLGTKVLFVGFFVREGMRQFSPWIVLAVLLPSALPATLRRLLVGVILLNGPVLLLVLRFQFTAENRLRVEEYFIPSWVCLSILIAGGLARLMTDWKERWRWGLALLLPLSLMVAGWRNHDLHDFTLVEDVNRAILNDVPDRAVYFAGPDYLTFPMVYLQAVEGLRKDVILGDITGSPSPRLREHLEARGAPFPDADLTLKAAQELLLAHSDRPLLFGNRAAVKLRKGVGLEPWSGVYLLTGERTTIPDSRPPPPPLLTDLDGHPSWTPLDRALAAGQLLIRAEIQYRALNHERAGESFERAASLCHDQPKCLGNVWTQAAESRHTSLAAGGLHATLRLDPAYERARKNLVRLLWYSGRRADSLRMLRGALPFAVLGGTTANFRGGHESTLLTASVDAARQGDHPRALAGFEFLALDTRTMAVGLANLASLYGNLTQDPDYHGLISDLDAGPDSR